VATYTQIIKKSDGEIDWRKPSEQLEREVRAYLGWPGSRTKLHDKDVTITKAHVVAKESLERVTEGVFSAQPTDMKAGFTIETKSGFLGVVCGKDILRIERLKPAGRNEMSAGEFLRGLKI
jgi:methionyl-tRNA formyltransferase